MASPLQLVGSVLLVAALSGYGLVLARMREVGARQRALGGERWWYSSGVDLVHLAGVLAVAAAHRALGLSGPQALLGAFASCLVVYGTEYLLGRRGTVGAARALWLALSAALAALPALAARGWMTRGLRALDRTLYGG